MKKSALAVFATLVLVPSLSFAAPIRRVDDSEYGQQSFNTACSNTIFTDLAGSGAKCFVSSFTTPAGFKQGYLVGYDSSVRDVDVIFSNLTVGTFGLVVCSEPDSSCDGTPTWDLDITNFLPSYANQFSQTVGSNSIMFSLSGAVAAEHVKGHEVAFLVLSDTPPTITVRARPSCALTLDYAAGTLNIGFTLQSPTPATWSIWLAAAGNVFKLGSIAIPAVAPPATVSTPIPGIPQIGLVGVLNQLSTAQGATCFDFQTVNTGP
jgi:hypothetical protein